MVQKHAQPHGEPEGGVQGTPTAQAPAGADKAGGLLRPSTVGGQVVEQVDVLATRTGPPCWLGSAPNCQSGPASPDGPMTQL